VLEEALEDDDYEGSQEQVDEKGEMATSPPDVTIGTSFDEKSGGLRGYQADVVDVHLSDGATVDEDGRD
jgi:hypothetical protein